MLSHVVLQAAETAGATNTLINMGAVGAMLVLAIAGFAWVGRRHVQAMERAAARSEQAQEEDRQRATKALEDQQTRATRALEMEVERARLEAASRQVLADALNELRHLLTEERRLVLDAVEQLRQEMQKEHGRTRETIRHFKGQKGSEEAA